MGVEAAQVLTRNAWRVRRLLVLLIALTIVALPTAPAHGYDFAQSESSTTTTDDASNVADEPLPDDEDGGSTWLLVLMAIIVAVMVVLAAAFVRGRRPPD